MVLIPLVWWGGRFQKDGGLGKGDSIPLVCFGEIEREEKWKGLTG